MNAQNNRLTLELTHIEDAISQDLEAGVSLTEVAMTYAMGIRSSWPTDWHLVNQMIIDRWSISGLKRVKKIAWSKV